MPNSFLCPSLRDLLGREDLNIVRLTLDPSQLATARFSPYMLPIFALPLEMILQDLPVLDVHRVDGSFRSGEGDFEVAVDGLHLLADILGGLVAKSAVEETFFLL